MGLFVRRLLPVLQLTRMALVFTAIADTACELLLRAQAHTRGGSAPEYPSFGTFAGVAFISMGLYGFGMSLNDIIDHRRDRQLAAHRPLPSGRIGLVTAHVICALLAGMGLFAGLNYALDDDNGVLCLALLFFTAALIAFYDYAGKYLVAPGLLTLGLIRFFHSLIPAPEVPLLWHPLWLLNHVAILSTVAYAWEAKRPSLTKIHYALVLGGLAFIDACAVLLVGMRRGERAASWAEALWVQPGLIVPMAATILFVALAVLIRRRAPNLREAGQRLMLVGLLWLIVYDAAFVLGYVSWVPAMMILALLPVSYLCVQLMRWWGKVLSLSQRPQFKRAG